MRLVRTRKTRIFRNRCDRMHANVTDNTVAPGRKHFEELPCKARKRVPETRRVQKYFLKNVYEKSKSAGSSIWAISADAPLNRLRFRTRRGRGGGNVWKIGNHKRGTQHEKSFGQTIVEPSETIATRCDFSRDLCDLCHYAYEEIFVRSLLLSIDCYRSFTDVCAVFRLAFFFKCRVRPAPKKQSIRIESQSIEKNRNEIEKGSFGNSIVIYK